MSSDDDNKVRVKDKLKKYLIRRPSFVELESKGIIKGMFLPVKFKCFAVQSLFILSLIWFLLFVVLPVMFFLEEDNVSFNKCNDISTKKAYYPMHIIPCFCNLATWELNFLMMRVQTRMGSSCMAIPSELSD